MGMVSEGRGGAKNVSRVLALSNCMDDSEFY